MLKTYLASFFIIFSTLSLSLGAQEISASKALQQRLTHLNTFQSAFVQNVSSVTGELLQQASGVLAIAKPTYLDWQVTTPDETRLLSKDGLVYLIDPFLEQVSIYDLSKMIEHNPLLLLLTDDASQWENFTVVQQVQKEQMLFEVSAKAPGALIQTLTLTFANNVLMGMSFVDTQGQVSRFVFSDAKMNIVLPEDTFTYTIPEYFTIDDQRVVAVPAVKTP